MRWNWKGFGGLALCTLVCQLSFGQIVSEEPLRTYGTGTLLTEPQINPDGSVVYFSTAGGIREWFTGPNTIFATFNEDDTIRLWDMETRESRGTIFPPLSQTFTFEFAPNDNRLMVGGNGSSSGVIRKDDIIIYDTETRAVQQLLRIRSSTGVAKFSLDG